MKHKLSNLGFLLLIFFCKINENLYCDDYFIRNLNRAVISCLAFSPDGNTLACAGDKGDVYICDVNTGMVKDTIEGFSNFCSSLVFSNDGKKIFLSSMKNNSIKELDVKSGELLKSYDGHNGIILSLAISPDGSILASCSADSSIKLWEVNSGTLLRTLIGHTEAVAAVDFSNDGSILASGTRNKILIWDITTGMVIDSFKVKDTSNIRSVDFSPDGKKLASGGGMNNLNIWDLEKKELYRNLDLKAPVWSVKFSPDGKTLLSGGSWSTLNLWDVETGNLKHSYIGHTDRVQSVAFHPDGKMIASGGPNDGVKLWRIPTTEVGEKKNERLKEFSIFPNPAREFIEIAFSSPRLKPWVDGEVGEIRIYNVLGECVKEIPPTPLLQRGTIRMDVLGFGGGGVFCKYWGVDGELC